MATRFVTRPGPLPPGVVSAVAYASDGLEPGMHRGLPSPWVTVVVSVGEPVRVDGTVERDGFDPARATAYDVVVGGLHDRAAQVEQPRAQEGVQLALHPLALEPLLGCRAADLTAVAEDGRDVLGPEGRRLHERVGRAPDLAGRLDAVVAWLARRADRADRTGRVRPEVARAWTLLRAPGVRVDDVAGDVALSPRQLHALVRAETGWSPKRLARMSRFDAVVGDLGAGRDLASVALRRGYADQAHLAREFAVMAGCPPTTWLAEERRNLQDGGHRHGRD